MRGSLLCLCAIVLSAGAAQADDWVPGYTDANGSNVPGYWRSDGSPVNNYSNLHNVNPNTARPRPKPSQNNGLYDDSSDDGSTIGDDETGGAVDGGAGDDGGDLGAGDDGGD